MTISGPTQIPNARAPRALLLGLGLSLVLAAATGHADGTVYKWTDAQGHVHYSDRPPADGAAQAVAVNTGYTHTGQKAQDASPAKAAPRPADNPPATASNAEKKVAADLAVAHEGDCKRAKATYETYIRVRHLYKAGGDDANPGEKQFLSDAELEQARVDARREMDEACGTGGQ